MLDDLEWCLGAPCTQVDPEVFFPGVGGSYEEARRICGSCDVREECLAWALRTDREQGLQHGMLGGLTPVERRQLAAGLPVEQPRRGAPADPRTIEAVRQLAGDGLPDGEIGEHLGLSKRQVWRIRVKHRIAAGQPPTGGVRAVRSAA